MATNLGDKPGKRAPWRLIGWGFAAALMVLPLVTRAPWTGSDYVFAFFLIGGVGLAFELVVRSSRNLAFRGAAAVALVATFLLIWISAAVSIIGDGDRANVMYLGVLGIGVVGSLIARGRAEGMTIALAVTAAAQALVAGIVLVGHYGAGEPPGALGILILNSFFVGLFAGSAWLFGIAARQQAVA